MNDRKLSSTTYPFTFLMVSSADHVTGVAGLSPAVTLSKNGGPFAAAAGAVSEVNLAAPAAPTTSGAASTGGFLAQSTTYYYKITATNAFGETTPSAETSYAVPASGTATNQVTLSWSAVAGAAGYKVYRGTATGGELLLATLGNVTTYADTTNATPAGSPPAANGTGCGWYLLAGNAADRNTLGSLLVHATGTGCDPFDDRMFVVPWDPFDGNLALTALNGLAAPATAGGLGILGTGAGSYSVDGSGFLMVSMAQALPGSPTAGSVGEALKFADTRLLTAAALAAAVWQDAAAGDVGGSAVANSAGALLFGRPTAPAIATAVWQDAAAGDVGAGAATNSAGALLKALSAAGTPPSAATIAAAVMASVVEPAQAGGGGADVTLNQVLEALAAVFAGVETTDVSNNIVFNAIGNSGVPRVKHTKGGGGLRIPLLTL